MIKTLIIIENIHAEHIEIGKAPLNQIQLLMIIWACLCSYLNNNAELVGYCLLPVSSTFQSSLLNLRLPNDLLSNSQVWFAIGADTCWTYSEIKENKCIEWNLRGSITWMSQQVRPWDGCMCTWDVHWGDKEGGKNKPSLIPALLHC